MYGKGPPELLVFSKVNLAVPTGPSSIASRTMWLNCRTLCANVVGGRRGGIILSLPSLLPRPRFKYAGSVFTFGEPNEVDGTDISHLNKFVVSTKRSSIDENLLIYRLEVFG